MNTVRPSRKELDVMSEVELKEKLYLDPGWAADYRSAIDRLRARTMPNSNYRPEKSMTPAKESVDIARLVRSSVGRIRPEEDEDFSVRDPNLGSLRPLAETILNSGWDFTDPDPKGMHYDPIGNRAFVEDFAYRDKYWDDMVARGQRKWNTIIDAFNRWLRQNKR
jgi:hypothetical protein